mgnify:CR=1 FL=1
MTIEKAKQYILEGGKITEEQALSLVNHPDKEALYEAAHQITRHFMGISSTLVPSSTPKAAIAARIVNGAHSRDITRPS